MAGSLSDYGENYLLDYLFGSTVYVGLSTADPTDDASGNAEPGAGSYARVAMAAGNWTAASGGALSNSAAAEFPEATGSWGTLTHFGIWDAASAGNMVAHGDLDESKTVGIGDTISFAIGELDTTLT
jgi:hypothetical protein